MKGKKEREGVSKEESTETKKSGSSCGAQYALPCRSKWMALSTYHKDDSLTVSGMRSWVCLTWCGYPEFPFCLVYESTVNHLNPDTFGQFYQFFPDRKMVCM
jgi:hypothetical protein